MLRIARLNGKPELFYTIQGEGNTSGKPTIFLRLSLCNLKCSWCDTTYTWDWKNYSREKEIVECEIEYLIQLIQEFNCKHLVITGGEPMLQQKELIELIKCLNNYWIEIETNGTIFPLDEFSSMITQFNVSPKLSNSNNIASYRDNQKAMYKLANIGKSIFKFVLQTRIDLIETLDIINRYGIESDKVYLMPEGKTRDEIIRKSDWLIEVCKYFGFNFSSRIHVMIYDSRRGV